MSCPSPFFEENGNFERWGAEESSCEWLETFEAWRNLIVTLLTSFIVKLLTSFIFAKQPTKQSDFGVQHVQLLQSAE